MAAILHHPQARALVLPGDPPADTEFVIQADELPALIAGARPGPCDVRRDPEEPLRLEDVFMMITKGIVS